MKILFYLYLYVTSYLLLVFISLALCYQLFLISTRFYSNPRGKFKFSGKTKTCLKYPFFSRWGSSNILIMIKALQTKQNYLILIPPNAKSILTSFDRFNHNYCSICVLLQPKSFCNFLLHNRRMCSANVKKRRRSVKIIMGCRKRLQAR